MMGGVVEHADLQRKELEKTKAAEPEFHSQEVANTLRVCSATSALMCFLSSPTLLVSEFRMALRSAHIAALRRGPKTNEFFHKHDDVQSMSCR
jgi:hypothetical protein